MPPMTATASAPASNTAVAVVHEKQRFMRAAERRLLLCLLEDVSAPRSLVPELQDARSASEPRLGNRQNGEAAVCECDGVENRIYGWKRHSGFSWREPRWSAPGNFPIH